MIVINFKSDSKENMINERETLHNALVGSPAYISSEIALFEVDDTTIRLIIGNNNDLDMDITISKSGNT